MSIRVRMWSNSIGHQRAAEDEQDEPDDHQADPARGDVEQREEDAEEQQRRAEVALDDDDAERDRPHRDHRREVRQRRQPERPEPRVLLDEQRPVLGQVAGQEDDEDDLEQLGRLAAERAELEGQALAVDLRAEARTSAAAGRRRPRPRCTCSGAASCRSGRRSRASSRRSSAPEQPDELDLGQAERRRRRTSGVTRSCGSRSISSSEIPPSIADGRQQDLVRPAAGEDLRGVGGEQRARGRSSRPCGSYRPNVPLTVAPSDTLPTTRATATRPSSRSSSQRGRGRIGPRTRGRRGRPGAPRRRPRGIRHAERPLEPHPDLADLELVAEAQRRDAVDPLAVDERAVGAAEVLEVPAPAAVGQDGVLGRGERVVDDDRVVDVATERRDDVEPERVAGRPARRSAIEDDQPPGPIGRLAGRRAQVAQQRPDDPVRGTGRGGPGTGGGRAHSDEQEAVHQSDAPRRPRRRARCPRPRAGRRRRGRPR